MSASDNEADKQRVHAHWRALDAADPGAIEALLRQDMTDDAIWRGPEPVGDLAGPEQIAAVFWAPLHQAFSGLRRECFILMGGRSSGRADGGADGRDWVGGTGVLHGRFERPWLGIPASGEPVAIRWGEFCRLDAGRIVETHMLLDVVDLMEQAGFSVLPPPRGQAGVYPPPAAGDGVMLAAQDEHESERSLAHIRRFIYGALNAYDETGLESMGIADFFAPDVAWYGPGGIGYCAGLAAFQREHQAHWLHAFPDRRVQDLDVLISEGGYSGASGWSGVVAHHRGEYLGVEPTGRQLSVNGLDFWKRQGERYVENWVFVDMIHLFRQLGVDLFERLN